MKHYDTVLHYKPKVHAIEEDPDDEANENIKSSSPNCDLLKRIKAYEVSIFEFRVPDSRSKMVVKKPAYLCHRHRSNILENLKYKQNIEYKIFHFV
jgi:hypothetical protein